eukprot:344975-Pleurochrysis_carterae.AAC.4
MRPLPPAPAPASTNETRSLLRTEDLLLAAVLRSGSGVTLSYSSARDLRLLAVGEASRRRPGGVANASVGTHCDSGLSEIGVFESGMVEADG